MAFQEALAQHMGTGLTTVARAWIITRKDGTRYGFTDHDQDLTFDDIELRADTGLSAMALEQGTGLSVDNSEAMGALSDAALSDADIANGRFDGAEVEAWLVNWADVSARQILFRGHIGEISRSGGGFRAELRGLTDGLNVPLGRVFQKPCPAVLGDTSCGFDTTTAGYFHEGPLVSVRDNRLLGLDGMGNFASGWFQRGRLIVLSGAAAGLSGSIKRDQADGEIRQVSLWNILRADLAVGDQVQLIAGCDKRFETCRLKFTNALNFQGFPDLPPEDWVVINPASTQDRDGGSLR